jgi:hypothetical protein
MKQYALLDMIADKIGLIEFDLNSIEVFKKTKTDVSYNPPPVWSDSGSETWEEFRAKRKKGHITNRSDPADDFPVATFSMLEPGGITIIQDDFIDLLHILKHKNLRAMRADYVSSVFFAIESADARLHYILGSFGVQQAFHTKRTKRSTEKKRKNRKDHKDHVLRSFEKLRKEHGSLKLSSKNCIAGLIMEDNRTVNKETGEKGYKMKMSKIKELLEELHTENKISLPEPRMKRKSAKM